MSPEEAAFEYELPRDLIAQHPLQRRADARLMIVDRKRNQIDHFHVRDMPELLRSSDRLVLNDTRVVLARLVGEREATGGRWQGLFLGVTADGLWRVVQKTRGSIQPGEIVQVVDRDGRSALKLRLIERSDNGQWLAVPDATEEVFALLDRIGRVPLPPYIRGGNMTDADVDRYQTVFAKHRGAVAAPTAGLHFSESLLRRIDQRGAKLTSVTLHVGLDTFRPISTPSINDHPMHSEWIDLNTRAEEEINTTRSEGGRIIAVGTTSVRVLETATRNAVPPSCVATYQGETDLFIRPPYSFRAVDALLTNFHYPRTTLLVLVSAFGGRELLRRAYEEAVSERYRFYSYGDAMLIL